MRLAVVYHLANPGGITRFTHALIDGLLQASPEIGIDYYVSDQMRELSRIPTFSDAARVRIVPIRDPMIADSNLDEPAGNSPPWSRFVRTASTALRRYPPVHEAVARGYDGARALGRSLRQPAAKHWFQFALDPDVRSELARYDAVYLPFPYYLEPATIDAPLIATFHDFNHRYFPVNFGRRLLRQMESQLGYWTRRSDSAVVSTRFVESDLVTFYPQASGRTTVVYVAPYSVAPLSEARRQMVLDKFSLADRGYFIYPSNHSYHKNVAALVMAADRIKARRGSMPCPVVLTGFGTDGIGTRKWPSFREVDAALGASGLVIGEDVRGLGFVSDEEVDALTRSARLVVSTSLYEAGCGPALDAWQFGVPVAFSNIPPFVEQLTSFGVEAYVFDPRDPEDIADTLIAATDDERRASEMARKSYEAIRNYDWVDAARGYLRAFAAAQQAFVTESRLR